MHLPLNALTTSKQLLYKIYSLPSIGRNMLPLVKSRLQLINLTRKVINCKTINTYFYKHNATKQIQTPITDTGWVCKQYQQENKCLCVNACVYFKETETKIRILLIYMQKNKCLL